MECPCVPGSVLGSGDTWEGGVDLGFNLVEFTVPGGEAHLPGVRVSVARHKGGKTSL